MKGFNNKKWDQWISEDELITMEEHQKIVEEETKNSSSGRTPKRQRTDASSSSSSSTYKFEVGDIALKYWEPEEDETGDIDWYDVIIRERGLKKGGGRRYRVQWQSGNPSWDKKKMWVNQSELREKG
jgi:hypothetical protein